VIGRLGPPLEDPQSLTRVERGFGDYLVQRSPLWCEQEQLTRIPPGSSSRNARKLISL